MYLLQSFSSDLALVMFFAAGVSLIISYFVIKAAVTSATRELREEMETLVSLKVMELQSGSDLSFLNDVDKVTRFRKARTSYQQGIMSKKNFEKTIEELQSVKPLNAAIKNNEVIGER